MSAEKTALKNAYEIVNTQDYTLDWTLITERGQ